MKAIAGAVLVLAGCVLLAAGEVADGLVSAANRTRPDTLALPGGAALVVAGLVVFVVGWAADTPRRERPRRD